MVLVALILLLRRSQDAAGPTVGRLDLQESPKPALEAPQDGQELAAPPSSADSRVELVDQDHRLVVCVVDDESSAAVEGAQVLVTDSRKTGALLRANNTSVERPAGRKLRRDIAQEATTGRDGCTAPISCPESATIEARLGERWGVATVNAMPEDHRVTVRLTQDLSVRVRVVRPDRAPLVGVPVALRRATSASGRVERVTESEAPDGVATFEHYQRRLLQGDGWQFAFAFPVSGDPSIGVEAAMPQAWLPELVLPGAGHLILRVRNAQGQAPQGEDTRLHLHALDDARNGEELYPDGPWSEPPLAADGRAEVPWIGVGLRVQVEVLMGDARCGLASFQGPSHDGEIVECEILVDDQPRTLTGRLVFANGDPWVSTSVGAFLANLPPYLLGPGSNYHITTDENGRFRLAIAEEPSSGHPFVLKLAAKQARASVAIESEVPPGGLDLGDVVLDHGRVLLAGQVVDASGQPIARADLDLSLDVHAVERNADPSSSMGRNTRSNEPSLAAVPARSAPDGSFTVFAREEEQHGEGTPLSLTTSCPGYVADVARPVRLGEEGVVVRLSAAGSLEGTLDLPEGMALGEIELELIAGGGRKHSLRPQEDRFRFESLAEDVYSLRVRRRNWVVLPGPPMTQVDGLQVVVGPPSRDPRLHPVRIDDGRTLVRVRVVDEGSAPISNAWVIHRGAEYSRTHPLTDGSGLCLIRVESLPIDAEVGASGYGKQRPNFASEDATVVLRKGCPVRFRANVPASAGDYRLRIQLFDVDADGMRGWPAIRTGPRALDVLDAGAGSPPILLGAGTYECVPMITVFGGEHSASGPVDLTESRRITVIDSAGEQEFEIEISQSELDAAVAKYKPK